MGTDALGSRGRQRSENRTQAHIQRAASNTQTSSVGVLEVSRVLQWGDSLKRELVHECTQHGGIGEHMSCSGRIPFDPTAYPHARAFLNFSATFPCCKFDLVEEIGVCEVQVGVIGEGSTRDGEVCRCG